MNRDVLNMEPIESAIGQTALITEGRTDISGSTSPHGLECSGICPSVPSFYR